MRSKETTELRTIAPQTKQPNKCSKEEMSKKKEHIFQHLFASQMHSRELFFQNASPPKPHRSTYMVPRGKNNHLFKEY